MNGPLSGLTVIVTRARHQAEELAARLRDTGANVIVMPMLDIGPPTDRGPLHKAAAQANQYDWIIFSSANAVRAFAAELPSTNNQILARVAAVGPATSECAEHHGFRIALMPEEYVAESLLAAFNVEDLSGRRVLIPSAEMTRDLIAPGLQARGALVDVVPAYRNIIPSDTVERAAEVFRADPPPDWVTVASSSAVNHLLSVVPQRHLTGTKIASIGPITSSTVRRYGLSIAVEAEPHTIPGLVEAIVQSVTHQSN